MKQIAAQLSLIASRQDARLIFFLLTIALFVIAGGAPDASGGVGL